MSIHMLENLFSNLRYWDYSKTTTIEKTANDECKVVPFIVIPVCCLKVFLFYFCVVTDRNEMQHIKAELTREIFSKIETSTPTKQDRDNTDNTFKVIYFSM